jgi:hypothetical protein
MKKTNKVVGYVKPVFGLCLFMMLIYGAYTPNQKAEVQQIVCIKFKAGTSENDIKKHLADFAQLRHDIPQIAAYSGGKTLGSNEYDVMHYVSFRTEEGPAIFNGHPKHKAFTAANEKQWEKVMVINADIER